MSVMNRFLLALLLLFCFFKIREESFAGDGTSMDRCLCCTISFTCYFNFIF